VLFDVREDDGRPKTADGNNDSPRTTKRNVVRATTDSVPEGTTPRRETDHEFNTEDSDDSDTGD